MLNRWLSCGSMLVCKLIIRYEIIIYREVRDESVRCIMRGLFYISDGCEC